MKRRRFGGAAARLAAAGVILTCLCASSRAAIMVVRGNRPVQNLGWPLGAEGVANLPGRLGYMGGPPFGGGLFCFYYRCEDSAWFNEALKTFAAIRAPQLEVVIHDGTGPTDLLRDETAQADQDVLVVDWTFTVWQPERWHRHFNDPRKVLHSRSANFRKPVAPPRIDVYVGVGPIVWNQVEMPANVRVIDKRAEAAPVKPVGGGLIRGSVYDMATGQPIVGAEVALAQYDGKKNWQEVLRATTDALGSCEIPKIPVGGYFIRIRAQGYASRVQGHYLNKANAYHEFVVELMREASIKGVVTDRDGKPIPGAKVRAYDPLGIDGLGYQCLDVRPATTDEQGRFEIRALPAGYTLLMCSARPLYQVTPFFHIYKLPDDDVRIVMGKTGIVRGKVVGMDGRPPAEKVLVCVRPPGRFRLGQWRGSTHCQPDGTFEFEAVRPGEYWVGTGTDLLADGADPNAVLVTVKAGETVEVKLTR